LLSVAKRLKGAHVAEPTAQTRVRTSRIEDSCGFEIIRFQNL